MSDWLNDNKRGLGIVRVSSRRQEGNISHETQEAEIRAYCDRLGIRLEAVLRIVESAKDSDARKKYAEAIARALTDDVRHVLFYMYDREARNMTDSERNEKLVKAGLLCIHYVREMKVLHKDSSDSDFFIRDVQAVTNKHFSRNLSSKVNDAMRQKAETGWYPSNQLPLGYALQRAKDEHGREMKRGAIVVRDPNERRVRQVVREFELRAEGQTFEQIRESIIAEGFIPLERASQYRANVIEARISNPFYTGCFVWQGQMYPGKHEKIVPEHLILAARAVARGRRPKPRDLAGNGCLAGGLWIRCSCGCAIVYEPVRKQYRNGTRQTFHYYRCTNGKKVHERRLYVREELLWRQFEGAVDAIQLPAAVAGEIAQALNESHRMYVAKATARILELKRQIKDLEATEDRDYQHFDQGVIDADFFRRQRSKLREKRADLTRELERAQSAAAGGYRETAATVVELAKCAKDLYLSRSPLERREFLEKLVSNPILEGASLRYDLKKPFRTLAEMNVSGEWRARMDQFLTECALLQGGNFLGDPIFSTPEPGDR